MSEIQSDWIVGRKEITSFAKCIQWNTVRQWTRKYGLVLHRWPNGKPAITKTEFEAFLRAFDKRRHR